MIGKKGQLGDFMLENFHRIIFLMVVLAALFIIINAYTAEHIRSSKVTAEVLYNRIIYSPVLWTDGPMTKIDARRVNSEVLGQAVMYPEDVAAARVTLIDRNGQPLDVGYVNRKYYDNWVPVSGLSGSGASTMMTRRIPVSYEDKGERRGVLEVSVVVPN